MNKLSSCFKESELYFNYLISIDVSNKLKFADLRSVLCQSFRNDKRCRSTVTSTYGLKVRFARPNKTLGQHKMRILDSKEWHIITLPCSSAQTSHSPLTEMV